MKVPYDGAKRHRGRMDTSACITATTISAATEQCSAIVLRPHQERGIDAVLDAFRRVRRVLFCAPTGYGKTATTVRIIMRALAKGRRLLFTVHRREIVLDTYRRLVAAGVPCGLVMAGEPVTDAPVQVACVATIAARGEHPPADLIVWDECQHTAAQSYRDIAAQYPSAWHLGLTATPERADGQGLRDAFDELVIGATVAELQSTVDPATGAAFLAECDVIAPPRRLSGATLAADPVEAWFAHANGRTTIAFCRSVAESKALAAAFCERGVVARHVDGTTPATERDATLAALARGEVAVVCNVMVLTEGFDAPRVKCILLARGCGSAATFLQMVGRGLRAWSGERCTIIDLGGAVREHGLPDEPRQFTLDGIRRAPKKARPWIRSCLVCGLTLLGCQSGLACKRCGTPWPAVAPSKVQPARLARVTRGNIASRAEMRASFDALVRAAVAKGYQPGWAAHSFRAQWGFWPRGLR